MASLVSYRFWVEKTVDSPYFVGIDAWLLMAACDNADELSIAKF